MSEPRGTPEASMEEILASIRRIISEDGSPPPPQPPAPQAAPPAASSPPPPAPQPLPPAIPSGPTSVWGIPGDRPTANGEELVLTQMLAEDGSVVALDRPVAGAPATTGCVEPSKARPLDVLLLTDALPPTLSQGPRPTAPVATQKPVAPAAPLPGEKYFIGLAAPESSIQSGAVVSQLTRDRARDDAPTLEELVRQSLEPKIREWLNANLKDIVERLVQQEIDRISRRAERSTE